MPRLVLARCRYKRNKFVEQIGLKVVGAVKAKSLFKWDRPKFLGAISCLSGKLSYFQSSGRQLTSLSTKSRPSKRQISGELLTVDCSEARKTKEEEVWNHLRVVPLHFRRVTPHEPRPQNCPHFARPDTSEHFKLYKRKTSNPPELTSPPLFWLRGKTHRWFPSVN